MAYLVKQTNINICEHLSIPRQKFRPENKKTPLNITVFLVCFRYFQHKHFISRGAHSRPLSLAQSRSSSKCYQHLISSFRNVCKIQIQCKIPGARSDLTFGLKSLTHFAYGVSRTHKNMLQNPRLVALPGIKRIETFF